MRDSSTHVAQFDDRYVTLLRNRDEATAEHFANHFSRVLDAKLASRLRNPSLAQDIRQETLRRVLEAVGRRNALRNSSCLESFVHRVCRNVLLEHWRKTGKVACGNQLDPPDHGVAPEEALQRWQNGVSLRKALSHMPEREGQVIKLLYLEELDCSDVSRRMGVTRDHLRVVAFRAIRSLRKLYQNNQRPIAARCPVH